MMLSSRCLAFSRLSGPLGTAVSAQQRLWIGAVSSAGVCRYMNTHVYREPSLPRRGPDRSSNPPLAFPCLDAIETRSESLEASLRETSRVCGDSGPEPSYTTGATLHYHSPDPLVLDWGGVLPEFTVAYETWGHVNADQSNVVLLHPSLSASSHAHSTEANPQPGWWEKFIGPGCSLDTDRFFVICTNIIGGCYGSTGPGSIDPADGQRYATRFPIITIEDMVRAQFRLLDHLGVDRLYASVGASLGGMQSLAAGLLFPERVGRVVSISGCARSHPYSIALRHTQRQVLMTDPHWHRGFYYDHIPPHTGMKLARQIATVTYRSGPEWGRRFGRRRADPTKPPALCPDFLIETYLDHSGEKFCLTFDANSMLYISKAMDLFDLSCQNQRAASARRADALKRLYSPSEVAPAVKGCGLNLPSVPYQEQEQEQMQQGEGDSHETSRLEADLQSQWMRPPEDLIAGLEPLANTPTLVMGVASDILFPVWQQRELAEALRLAGNQSVELCELSEEMSQFGHDTFLLDIENVGGKLGEFMSR